MIHPDLPENLVSGRAWEAVVHRVTKEPKNE